MATFAYFMSDPATDTVEAATIGEAAQIAGQKYADAQPEIEGTSTFPIWVVAVSQIKAGDCTVTVSVNRKVTVTPRP